MNIQDLKRYPRLVIPGVGESLPGFLYRLAEENGWARAGWARQDIGLHSNQTDWDDFHLKRLAIRSGQSEEVLRAMDCPAQPRSDVVYFKGHPIDKRMLDRMAMRYCPVCLADQGYHQSVWFLRFVTICPIHKCRIVDRCQACKQPLGWDRKRFLECKCGTSLPTPNAAPEFCTPDQPLHAIRSLYEKCGVPHDGEPALSALPMPAADLDLENFCSLLWFVGSTRDDFATYRSRCGQMQHPTEDMHAVLAHGYRMLSEWPKSFHTWLDHIRVAPKAGWTKGLNKQFKLLERKLRKLRRPQVLSFIQDAVLAYAAENGIYVRDSQSLLVASGSARQTGMISIKEAARILGCAPDTARNIAIGEGWLDPRMRNKGGAKAIPEHLVHKYKEENPRELGLDAVRELLNVRHETLEELLDAGLIGQRRAGQRYQAGAHNWRITEADIEEFKARLSACIRPGPVPRGSRLVSLKTVAGRHYLHRLGYVDFIAAVLRGELIPRGHDEEAPGPAGLLFEETEVIRFYASHGSARVRCLTPAQAGRLIGMPEHHVRAAVVLGLLPSEQLTEGRRSTLVSVDDAERFSCDYVSTIQLAELHGCTDQALRAELQARGIAPAGSCQGTQPGCSFYERQVVDGLELKVVVRGTESPQRPVLRRLLSS